MFNAVAAETTLLKCWENGAWNSHADIAKVLSWEGRSTECLPFIFFMLYDSSVSPCVLVPKPKTTDRISGNTEPRFLHQHFCFFFNRAEKYVHFSIWSNIIGEITKSVLQVSLFSTDSTKPCPCVSLDLCWVMVERETAARCYWRNEHTVQKRKITKGWATKWWM